MGQRLQPTPQRITIGVDHAGQRLDRVVAQWRGRSRGAVLRLLEAGALRHNGRGVSRGDKGLLLRTGDVLELDDRFADDHESPRPDAAMPLEVLAEGPGWVAVNKPAGVPVRPHALDEVGTVLNAVAARYPGVAGIGEGGLRSGVVHRLDNETSGVLLVATEQAVWERLRQAFAEHRAHKRYRAILHGEVPESGQAELALRVARHVPAHVEVCESVPMPGDARRCGLSWRVVERFGRAACLVEVDLHTGFLHQIRVMMSDLGHPVVGDAQYAGAVTGFGAPRQMLHAASLSIDEIAAQAPLPDDFRAVITALARG